MENLDEMTGRLFQLKKRIEAICEIASHLRALSQNGPEEVALLRKLMAGIVADFQKPGQAPPPPPANYKSRR